MPTYRKSKSKSKTKTIIKLSDTGISRLDKLPIEIRSQIYDNNYLDIYPIFLEHLKNRLTIRRVHYDIIVYDYDKIIKKLRIKNSDINNFTNLEDKRNFKDFNKKINKLLNNYLTPVIIEYGEIREIIDTLSVSGNNYHDFEYYLNEINIVESKLIVHINELNKLLYILKLKYNSSLSPMFISNMNNAINNINKVTKKLLPLVTNKKNTRYTRSLNNLKKSRDNTRKIRSI